MDSKIESSINNLLKGTSRKIVFWYDDEGQYKDEVESIQLQNATLHILTDSNWFATKMLLEEQDPDTNFLIYAPFSKPEDRENHLADTWYYAEHFSSNRMTQLTEELGMDAKYADVLKQYSLFFNAATRRNKFMTLQVEHYNKENIELGILCVIANVKRHNFDELLKAVITESYDDNAIINEFEKFSAKKTFWDLCEKYYGYMDEEPSVQRVVAKLLVTYTATGLGEGLPKSWESYVSGRKNDCQIFVKNIMALCSEQYDVIAEKVAVRLKAYKLMPDCNLSDIVKCDTFHLFDDILIQWLVEKLEDEMIDEKVGDFTIPELCDERIHDSYHYADVYYNQYKMLFYAYKMLKEITMYSFKPSVKEVVDDYVVETYQIDTYYRKFYYYMDLTGLPENFEELRDLIENIYTNKYLANITAKWNQILTDDVYQNAKFKRQQDFYKEFVRPSMAGGRTFVIISDGMRYECAKELMERFEMDEKCEAKIEPVISVLPSETTLGMASTLPHEEIIVDGDMNITVDDMPCNHKIEERQRVLNKYVPNAVCVQYKSIQDAKRADIKEMFQGKDLIYIYHNQIDNRGEHAENEIFNACEDTIREIHKLVRKLTEAVTATRFIITADHGFIYKRDKLDESDKISMDKKDMLFTNKRFLITDKAYESDSTIRRALAYLSVMNKLYVVTPIGANIIKAPGGGQNYVHGGSSLQEMIVPVISLKTIKGKKSTNKVDVILTSITRKVSDLSVNLDFIQTEPVTDVMKGRNVIAYFMTNDEKKISYDVPIRAVSKDKDASKRVTTEKFTLKSGSYKPQDTYYLVIEDEDEDSMLQQYEFTIDVVI